MMMRKQITLTKIVFASSWHSVLHIGFSKPHLLALRTKSISRSIKVNTNNKKLFMFFPLERKNFRLSAFRGIRLFAHSYFSMQLLLHTPSHIIKSGCIAFL